jgi:hypothetical protein
MHIDSLLPLENTGLEDLVVTNGPDPYVYLSTDKSALDFVNLGRLKANIGNQNYPLRERIGDLCDADGYVKPEYPYCIQ